MENSFHSLKFLGSEGGTSHGNFFGDDLPNPKTAEMSQITAGNSLSASKSGETSRSTHLKHFVIRLDTGEAKGVQGHTIVIFCRHTNKVCVSCTCCVLGPLVSFS